ncbi:MAG: septal ring-binding cell division protein DamX [Paraglaciecola sp.]|jgi:septal ring-binding cell division protein DamX
MKIIPRDFVKAVTTITLVTTVLIIAACSTIPPSSTPAVPEGMSATEFYEKMAEFERMKPSLQRLAALEPEFKELISQLTQIAQSAEVQEVEALVTAKPVAKPQEKVQGVMTNDSKSSAEQKTLPAVVKMTTSNPTEVKNNTIDKPNQNRGLYTLQLSAVTDKQKLLLSWQNMQQKHKQVLVNLVAISQEVNVSGVTFYRIKAGFYNTLQEAKKACASLKQASANCLVSDNRGEDIQ